MAASAAAFEADREEVHLPNRATFHLQCALVEEDAVVIVVQLSEVLSAACDYPSFAAVWVAGVVVAFDAVAEDAFAADTSRTAASDP
jgi:hypothetical protein